MNIPKVIYLQTCGDCMPNVMGSYECDKCDFDNLGEVTWCKDKINESDSAYFSEEHIRELLRDEYEQANDIIDYASRAKKPLDEGLIDVEKSIESAIKKLKGGENA